MKTPILFIIFNRPKTTKEVFEVIKQIKPKQLFIAADGPRLNKEDEKEKCKEVRKTVTNIDWNCEVKTLFREKNLGCKLGVSSAINWFFENVEEGIILEDDCVPNKSFFYFCDELLNRYRDSEKIMHISGSNLQFGEKFGTSSYYFSHCPHVWGWATWKRAWRKYDLNMTDLDNFVKSKKTYEVFQNKKLGSFWNSLFKFTKDKSINTWDVQWNYSILNADGLSITPNLNLIRNIGFGSEATHTKEINNKFEQNTRELNEIIHPTEIIPNLKADYTIYKKVYFRNIFDRISSKIKYFLNK
jgi:hypothetical protein